MHAERKNIDWQPEHIEFIRQSYIAGKSAFETIEDLRKIHGIIGTEKSIQSVLYRYCRKEVAENQKHTKGTRHSLRFEARKLAATGLAPSVIARTLRVTIDCVYSWVDRESRPLRKQSFDIRRWLSRQDHDEIPDDPLVNGGRLITELKHDQCRWPIGKDIDGLFRFCGCHFSHSAIAARASPYCDEHAAHSVKETTKKRGPMKINIVANNDGDGPVPISAMLETKLDDHKIAA